MCVAILERYRDVKFVENPPEFLQKLQTHILITMLLCLFFLFFFHHPLGVSQNSGLVYYQGTLVNTALL